MRIAAAQTPEFRDDVTAALGHLVQATETAAAEGASLLCFPEGFLQGYPTDEAAARQAALHLGSKAFRELLDRLPPHGPTLVFGLIETDGDRLFNSAAVVKDRVLLGRYRKAHLLARERCFTAGEEAGVFEADGVRFGINICNDMNFPGAAHSVAERGARLILGLANNMLPPDSAARWKDAHNAVRGERCRETGLWLVSADVAGERDGWVSWGPTAVLSPDGEVMAQLPLGRPGLLTYDLPFG